MILISKISFHGYALTEVKGMSLFMTQINKNEIEYICPKCKTKEMIPTEIVEMLDKADQIGVDTSIPPRFHCKYCSGKMVPKYYIGVNGKIYKYED